MKNETRPMIETVCKACGKTFLAERFRVIRGMRKTCSIQCRGRVARASQKNSGRKPTHGACVNGVITSLYRRWDSMKARCMRKSSGGYKLYGARGISVCKEWVNDFAEFRRWANDNGYTEALEIDRINNNLGYEPSNCRWVNKSTNSRNKRSSPRINDTTPLDDAHEKLGITRGAFRTRIYKGLSPELAARIPKVKNGIDRKNFKKNLAKGLWK